MTAVFRSLLVAALMISIGLHWALLQSVAWVGMAVTYSVEKGSVVEGLSETFDGEHPCPLCKAVKKGAKAGSSNSDKVPTSEGKDLKLTLVFVSVPQFVFEALPVMRWAKIAQVAQPRAEEPVAPPPRVMSLA